MNRSQRTLAGFAMVLLSVAIALIIKCPSNIQLFVLYTITGVGISLIFVKSAERTNLQIRILNAVIVITGSVALPFILYYTNPIGAFKADGCAPGGTVTVSVHGPKGTTDLVLRSKGKVMMDRNGDRQSKSINDYGQTFFGNVQIGDRVTVTVDGAEPYSAVYPDSVYIVPENRVIYLKVDLFDVDRVHGRVVFDDQPLADVIVSIDMLRDTTDATGAFSISIPRNMQQASYNVSFTKPGFVDKPVFAQPQAGALDVLMEKK